MQNPPNEQLGAERWRVRRAEGAPEIARGGAFHVVELRGLALAVEAWGDRKAGRPDEIGIRHGTGGP